jgi:hypothetical protein
MNSPPVLLLHKQIALQSTPDDKTPRSSAASSHHKSLSTQTTVNEKPGGAHNRQHTYHRPTHIVPAFALTAVCVDKPSQILQDSPRTDTIESGSDWLAPTPKKGAQPDPVLYRQRPRRQTERNIKTQKSGRKVRRAGTNNGERRKRRIRISGTKKSERQKSRIPNRGDKESQGKKDEKKGCERWKGENKQGKLELREEVKNGGEKK